MPIRAAGTAITIVLAFGLSLVGANAQTQDEALTVCLDAPEGARCVPVFACIEPAGDGAAEAFLGRAIEDDAMADAGSLDGALASGAACVGRWRTLPDGRGVAEGDCEDGRSFEIEYGFRHPATGTLVGRGFTNRREPIQGWADGDVRRFFQERLGSPRGALPCGERSYPVS